MSSPRATSFESVRASWLCGINPAEAGQGVNRGFESVVGIVTFILGATLIPTMKQPVAA